MSDTSPSTDQDTTAQVGCDCIKLTDQALAAHNTRLSPIHRFDLNTGAVTTCVAIQTVLIEKKRGARPLSIVPSFCPFCGTRYPADQTATAEAVS